MGSTDTPRLLDQVSIVCRRRHLSPRTEDSYRFHIRKFIYFHGKRHPSSMGGPEVEAFLNHLASERHLSASSQTQALNALVFLYDSVLSQPLILACLVATGGAASSMSLRAASPTALGNEADVMRGRQGGPLRPSCGQ